MNALQHSLVSAARTLLQKVPTTASQMLSLPQQQQYRFMSKYISKSAKKRLPLTTKRAKKGFYKGKGGTKEGRLSSKANFIVDPLKRLKLLVPDLEGFAVSLLTLVKVVCGGWWVVVVPTTVGCM